MILGFDNDDTGIFDAQRNFIRDARITSTMIGMLHAIPKTPLHARLAADGRLDLDDRPQFGTNVIPLKISREELRAVTWKWWPISMSPRPISIASTKC